MMMMMMMMVVVVMNGRELGEAPPRRVRIVRGGLVRRSGRRSG